MPEVLLLRNLPPGRDTDFFSQEAIARETVFPG